MALSTLLKPTLVATGAASLVGLGSLALTAPAHAFSFDTWTPIGDVVQSGNSATLTNAFADGSDDPNNLNISGTDPVAPNALEAALGLTPGALGSAAQEGSAISFFLFGVATGDSFSFDWNFSELDFFDRGFVSITDGATESIFDLTGSSPFSYIFGSGGNYTIGIGVLDQVDIIASSVLNVSNAQFTPGDSTPIPTPALLPGLVGLGLAALRKKREDDSELSA